MAMGWNLWGHSHTNAHTSTHAHKPTHTSTHSHIHAHTHPHTLTHTHTHTHTHPHTCTFTRVESSVLIVTRLPAKNSATNIIFYCTGPQTFCGKWPRRLLQHGLRAAHEQIAISGVPKRLNYCVTYSKYSTSLTKQSKVEFGLSLKLCVLFIYALKLYLLAHSV